MQARLLVNDGEDLVLYTFETLWCLVCAAVCGLARLAPDLRQSQVHNKAMHRSDRDKVKLYQRAFTCWQGADVKVNRNVVDDPDMNSRDMDPV